MANAREEVIVVLKLSRVESSVLRSALESLSTGLFTEADQKCLNDIYNALGSAAYTA